VTRGLAAFIGRRVLSAAAFVFVVSAGTLMLARLAPGDATAELQMSGANAATVAQARTRLGLDRSAGAYVVSWLKGLAHFDLGVSSQYSGRPVAPIVAERAANTAKLATIALLVATVIGLPLGILTAARPRSVFSAIVGTISIALVSCPPLVGALGLLFLAVTTHWLSAAPGGLMIPVLALALPMAATFERLQSRTTMEALGAPDLIAGASRGIGPARLLWIHAARQSLRPVLGVYGIAIGSLFSGSLAVELITGWPGLGRLAYDALTHRDLFLAAGCALFGAICLAVGNLVADVARAVVDPRVRE